MLTRTEALLSALKQFPVRTRLATHPMEITKYWTIRRESFNLLRKRLHDKHTAPFIDDMCVRAEQLPEFLTKLNRILKKYSLTYTIAGHVGDGNFHIIPLMNLADPRQRSIIPKLAEKVYDLVFDMKGSMSGEHNDGLIRSPYLRKMYGNEMYSLFEQTKYIFDPHNIFNPRKKIRSTNTYAMDHMIKD